MFEKPPKSQEKLKVLRVPIDSLVPIQAAGVRRKQLSKVANIDSLPEVIRLPEYNNEAPRFLLIDGNHRVRNKIHKGEKEIEVKEISNDNFTEAMAISLVGLHSVEEVLEKYYSTWKPLVEAKGIKGVADLPITDFE